MAPDDFRRLALSFDGALEGSHMGKTDFRAPGGIFATLGYPDAAFGMVKLTPEQQEMLTAAAPEVFSPAVGGWGRRGSTLVRLGAADEATLERALGMAWTNRTA